MCLYKIINCTYCTTIIFREICCYITYCTTITDTVAAGRNDLN
jgi:hypothetical protein